MHINIIYTSSWFGSFPLIISQQARPPLVRACVLPLVNDHIANIQPHTPVAQRCIHVCVSAEEEVVAMTVMVLHHMLEVWIPESQGVSG